jgi:photosystem II stability/assembly factor-like uncharacterized protein
MAVGTLFMAIFFPVKKMKMMNAKVFLVTVLMWTMHQAQGQQPAEIMPLSDQSLILSVAKVGTSLVMVGERGHVLKSKDEGKTWTQIDNIPVNITLTKVIAHNNHVWAMGHDAAVIHSKDGGDTWELQFYDADREVPLLSGYFEDENRGFIIGAYGTLLSTEDGGDTWDDGLVHDELDYHLNDITLAEDGNYYIAGEAGFAFKSEDGGYEWTEIELPYMGSMFGVATLGDEIVLYGLRGNILTSTDQGETWEEVYTDIENSLFGSTRLNAEQLLLVGANGTRLIYSKGGDVTIMDGEDTGDDYADALAIGGQVVLVGETGHVTQSIKQ